MRYFAAAGGRRARADMAEGTGTARSGGVYVAACAVVVLVSAALRLAGIFDDLWIDEIWSLELVRSRVSAPLDVVTAVHHDNNHWLNSLYLYAVGPDRPLYVYRLPSLVLGTGTVLVGWSIGRQHGRLEGLLCAWLLGLSYILIHYSSEARGYGPAVFFAVLGFGLTRRQVSAPSAGRGLVIAGCAVLGILSQLTFMYVLAALMIWTAVVFDRTLRRWPDAVKQMLLMHAPPLATLAAIYLIDLRRLVIGGGEVSPVSVILSQTVAWTLGSPEAGVLTVLAAVVAVAAIAFEIWSLRRRPDREWVFFAAVFAFPVLPLLLHVRADFYPRYILMSIPFALVLLARFLARLLLLGRPGARIAAGALLLAFTAGNLAHTAAFLRDGRGQYRAALAYMVDHSPGGDVVVTSDQDFRNSTILGYYAARDFPAARLHYVPTAEWQNSTPHWAVLHAFRHDAPADEIVGPNGKRYALRGRFPYSGASGWNWYVYEIDPGP